MKTHTKFWLIIFALLCAAGHASAVTLYTHEKEYFVTSEANGATILAEIDGDSTEIFSFSTEKNDASQAPTVGTGANDKSLRLYYDSSKKGNGASITFTPLGDVVIRKIVFIVTHNYTPTMIYKIAGGEKKSTTWNGDTLTVDNLYLTSDQPIFLQNANTESKQLRLLKWFITYSVGKCTAPTAELSFNTSSVTMEVGQSEKLLLNAGAGNGNTILFSSSDPSIAQVDADGLITGVARGEATITATQAVFDDGAVEYCSQAVQVPVTVEPTSYVITWQTPYGSKQTKIEQELPLGNTVPTYEVAPCGTDYPYFAGWIEENIGKEPSYDITFVDSATTPTAHTTYYAAFADEARVKAEEFSSTGSLSALKSDERVETNVTETYSGTFGIKMANNGEYIQVNIQNPEKVTFNYNRRGGSVVANVLLQYSTTNTNEESFVTMDTWNVGGSQTTNTMTLTNSKPFPYGTIYVRFLYEQGSGNIAVGPISISTATQFPPATLFVTYCCDAWPTQPTIVYTYAEGKSSIDADASETLAAPTITNENANYKGTLSFASSNPQVATVDATTGEVTAVAAGTANIIATWSGDKDFCDVTASTEVVVTGKISLIYDRNAADATGDMAEEKIDAGSVELAENGFARTGYHFLGWATTADGKVNYSDKQTIELTTSITLYAVWEINNYAVTKGDELNGTFTLSAETVNHGDSIVVTATPATHYHFENLSIDPAENGTIDGQMVKNIVGALTITANFAEDTKYTINWSNNDAVIGTTQVYAGEALAAVVEAEVTSCDTENYPDFYGWSATPYGSAAEPKTEAPALVPLTYKPVADGETLYAVFANGIDGGGQKMTSLAVGDKVMIVSGDSVEFGTFDSTNNRFIAAKYTDAPAGAYIFSVVQGNTENSFAFLHDGKYLAYPTAGGNKLTETTTLNNYSSWTASFSGTNVTLKNVASSSYTIQYNSANVWFAAYKTNEKPIQLIRSGALATKWMSACCTAAPFTEVKDATLLLDTAVVGSTTQIDLTTLIIGTGNGNDITFKLAENYANVALAGSTFEGSVLGKFTVIMEQAAKDGKCYNANEIVISIEPKNSTIVFDRNDADATGEMADLVAETLTNQELTEVAFEKIGYHFTGWNTLADGTGTTYADKATVAMHSMTLYAQWEINKYGVTLNQTGDGEVEFASEVEHGGSVTIVATPATGYKLGEITITPETAGTLSGTTVSDITEAITVNVEFVALAQYTITYRDADNEKIYEEKIYEGEHLNPDLSLFGCERMPFIGFSPVEVADVETFEPITLVETEITSDTTLWAVYTYNRPNSGLFDPAKTTKSEFRIYADYDGVEKFAGALTSGKYKMVSTLDDAEAFTFTSVGDSIFTIKHGSKYVSYGTSGTDLKESTSAYNWKVSAGTKGSWRVASVNYPTRAIVYGTGTKSFGAFATQNIKTTDTIYYDIEIGYNTAARYTSSLNCDFVFVEGVSLPANDTIELDEKKTLVATFTPENPTNRTLVWKSSSESVVTVDAATGEITGVAQGSAVITATSVDDDSYSASCRVLVRRSVTEISLDQLAISVKECDDNGVALTATVLPEDATNPKVIWSSSDETVAIASGEGVVYGYKPGTAVITATTVDGGLTAECEVTVLECVKVTNIALDFDTLNFRTCEKLTQQLTATVSPDDAEDKTVTWKSNNTKVATVNNGLVMPVAIGETVITATANDGSGVSAKCVVVVEDCPDALEMVESIDGVFVRNGSIVIERETAADIFVYSAAGQMVACKNGVASANISVPQGVYVVAIGSQATKVVVK